MRIVASADTDSFKNDLRSLLEAEALIHAGNPWWWGSLGELRPVVALATLFVLLSVTPLNADDTADALKLLPEKYREAVRSQLAAAGDNRPELLAAMRAVKPEQRPGLAFLLTNMPPRDLASLSKDFLVENVEYAYRARAEVPWGRTLPDELFFNDVLPYANVNERRDAWRKDFYERFVGLARQCKTPGEAAVRLNQEVFKQLKVQYHATKRPKPDQSPYESTKAGYASCTGLSILLADACRAVCVPSRLAGTPMWTNHKGNHSWVEVWDRRWHYTGAAEPAPLDTAWFTGIAAKADPARPEHCIYAASWERTGIAFPLVWAPQVRYVPAVDVTRFYTGRGMVTFRVVDRRGGRRIAGTLTVRLAGRIVAQGAADGEAEFQLAGGQTYEVQVQPHDDRPGAVRKVAVANEDGQSIEVPLDGP